MVEIGLGLGEKAAGEQPLINELAGIQIQKQVLGALDPSSPLLDTGNTVQQQLDSLNSSRNARKALDGVEGDVLLQMSEANQVSFYDRVRMFGEAAAIKWAAEKCGVQ